MFTSLPLNFNRLKPPTATTLTGFNLTTQDSYFTTLVEVFTNHNLAKNTYFMNHIEQAELKIMVLKPTKKYQII